MRGVKPCGREQKAENLCFSKPRISGGFHFTFAGNAASVHYWRESQAQTLNADTPSQFPTYFEQAQVNPSR
jgi:hypothetical protein